MGLEPMMVVVLKKIVPKHSFDKDRAYIVDTDLCDKLAREGYIKRKYKVLCNRVWVNRAYDDLVLYEEKFLRIMKQDYDKAETKILMLKDLKEEIEKDKLKDEKEVNDK